MDDDMRRTNMQLPTHVQEHIDSIRTVDYFSGSGPLPEGCKLYKTRAAAWDAAWDAAGDAAWDAARTAARDAAGDAALAAECLLMRDHIAPEHLAYALMRWAIWVAGYGVAVEVDGVHYCYRRP